MHKSTQYRRIEHRQRVWGVVWRRSRCKTQDARYKTESLDPDLPFILALAVVTVKTGDGRRTDLSGAGSFLGCGQTF